MLFVPPSMPSVIPDAFAQTTPSTLILDPLPSVAQVGDTIVFSGQLMTADGEFVITGATIHIKDDISFGTDIAYGTLTTDDNGRFSGTWNAVQRSTGGSYDFFTVYEGSANIDYARSQTYSVTVATAPTPTPTPVSTSPCELTAYNSPTLILDPIPIPMGEYPNLHRIVTAGDTITFTGRLFCATDGGTPFPNVLIQIKDHDSVFGSDLIVTGKTNANGEFSISWVANLSGQIGETDLDIYAEAGPCVRLPCPEYADGYFPLSVREENKL